MKNSFISLFENKVVINIKGKNINRFLKRLISHKVDLLDIKYINRNEINLLVRAKDYKKIEELKTIYDIFIVDVHGMLKIKRVVKINSILIISFIFGVIFLIFLSNVIFDVEVIHTNRELRTLILNELQDDGIVKLRFQKNYDKVQEIKSRILSKHKDKIEWLEIENVGTKYIIRVEERKLPVPDENVENRHIVARKSAIIKKIDAEIGEVVREINDYVKPGDIIISGEIKLYDQVKDVTSAKGKVYGEVWYQTKVTYPLTRRTERLLSNRKKVLVIQFLNKKIELFNLKPFKDKKIKQQKLIYNSLLPINLSLEEQQELKIVEEMNTIDEAIDKALSKGKEKIEEKLSEDEYIISQNSLKVDIKSSKIELDIFYVVYEDITSYQPIVEMPLEPDEE